MPIDTKYAQRTTEQYHHHLKAVIMKSFRLAKYNEDVPAAIDSMTCEEIPVPEPQEGTVLIKNAYCSVNPIDWKIFSGGFDGYFPVKNFPYTPGFDIAGVVEKVGPGVTNLAVGDRIIANLGLVETCVDPPLPQGAAGAFSEYSIAPSTICAKVGDADFESVVGLSLAGLTAYQGLFTGSHNQDLGKCKSGDKVLILGGAGGVGSIALQLAANAGCHVTTTASPAKFDFVKGLGAKEVINYREQDWGEVLAGQDYDLIYDSIGLMDDLNDRAPKVLKKGGKFISIANFDPSAKGTDDVLFQVFLLLSKKPDLDKLVQMVKNQELKIVNDKIYSFDETIAALKHSLGGRSTGKVLIKV
jgi:NADPH:quinone reductase-like Zn-dependent oxidoreductase